MKTGHNTILSVLLAVAGVALNASSARAAQTYTAGDVFIGFRSTTNPQNGLIFNVGNISQFTNTSFSNFTFGSVGTTGADLAQQFGSGWYTDATVTWGVFSALSGQYALASKAQPINGTVSTAPLALNSSKTGSLISGIGTVQSGYVTSTAATFTANSAYQTGVANGTYYAAVNANPDFTSAAWASGTSIEGSVNKLLDLYYFTPNSVQLLNPVGKAFSVNNSGVFTVVPEPSTYALIGVGALLLLVAYRRRTAA